MSTLTRQDELGFAEFYAANHRSVYLAVWAVLGDRGRAEEITQEAFVRLVPRWRRISRYGKPEAWIRTVALRLASNHRRRRSTQREVLVKREELARLGDFTGQADQEGSLELEEALQRLPHSQRTVVALHYLLNLPLSEISQITGAPINTVKTRLHRARATLAATIGLGKEHCRDRI